MTSWRIFSMPYNPKLHYVKRTYPTVEEYLDMYRTMTRRQIAEKLHVSAGTLSSWLNRHVFSLEVQTELDKIAAARARGRIKSKNKRNEIEEAEAVTDITDSASSDTSSLLNEKLYRNHEITIGEYLEMYRTMQQAEIAKKIGVSKASIENVVYEWKKKHRDSDITKEIQKITSDKKSTNMKCMRGTVQVQAKAESEALSSLAEKYNLTSAILDNFLSSLSYYRRHIKESGSADTYM